MTPHSGSPTSILGKELADALDRSLETSLRSLFSLRHAVKSYAIHKRKSGMTLDELYSAAAGILTSAEDDRADGTRSPAIRDAELSKQLRQWCQDDYMGRS